MDESYLTSQEKSIMFVRQQMMRCFKTYKIKNIRERRRQNKTQMNKMADTFKNAYLYKFEPTPPSRKALEIRRLGVCKNN